MFIQLDIFWEESTEKNALEKWKGVPSLYSRSKNSSRFKSVLNRSDSPSSRESIMHMPYLSYNPSDVFAQRKKVNAFRPRASSLMEEVKLQEIHSNLLTIITVKIFDT